MSSTAASSEDGKSKPEYTADFKGLVDIARDADGKPVFLVKKDGHLVVKQERKTKDGKIYLPPPKNQMPWLLPRAEEVKKYYDEGKIKKNGQLDAELFDDLVAYHKSISDLPLEEHYQLLAAWDMHTYLLEQVDYSPIICFFAVPERGKSRTGKGMVHVAWRGVHVESLRSAYLFRMSHRLKATLFFDVMDMWDKAERNDSEDILLLRFEKGAVVGRVLYPDRGPFKDIEYFSVFGPTIIGTNESVHQILETRAIQITMPETEKRFEKDVRKEDGLELKERLLAFRARHLYESLPEMEKPASGRLGDIMRPIQQIIHLVRPELEDDFLNLVRMIRDEKLLEKSESLEAKLTRVVWECKHQVVNRSLSIKVIADALNQDIPEKFRYSLQRIGRVLASMGFKKTKVDNGASAILWDDGLIEQLKKHYGV